MVNNIQLLRAVAAYLVVIYHTQPHLNNLLPRPFETHIGAVGVDIFFVISGCIIVLAVHGKQISPTEFWTNRIIRIVPLYWLATIAMILPTFIGFNPSGLHDWDIGDLLSSLFFIPNVRLDGVAEPILSPGWTLIYEMFFYFLFGALLLVGNRLWSVVILSAVFVFLSIVGWSVQPLSFGASYYLNPITLEFSAGCILGLIYTRTNLLHLRQPRIFAIILLSTAITVIILSDIYYVGLFASAPAFRLICFGIPAVAIVSAMLIFEKAGTACKSEFLLAQGAASYSIYLFHPLILHVVFKILSPILPTDILLIAITIMFMAVMAVCFLGTFIHFWLEKPISHRLNSYRKTMRERSAWENPADKTSSSGNIPAKAMAAQKP